MTRRKSLDSLNPEKKGVIRVRVVRDIRSVTKKKSENPQKCKNNQSPRFFVFPYSFARQYVVESF